MNNFSLWKNLAFQTGSNIFSGVCFLDVDFDGELELVVGSQQGSDFFTYLEFYKVVGNNIIKLNTASNDFPDIINYDMTLYSDSNGLKEYYGCDYNFEYIGNQKLSKGTLCSFSYKSPENAVIRKKYFSSTNDNEYKQLEKQKLENMRDMNLSYKFVDISKLSSESQIKQALVDSYNAFSYDGYTAKSYTSNNELSEEYLKSKLNTYGKVSVWEYHDYNGNGTNEAYGVVTETKDNHEVLKHIYFIDSTGKITEMPENFRGTFCYTITRKYSKSGNKGFFSVDIGNGGSSWQTLLYGVKDNQPYELDVSGKLQGFYYNEESDRFYTTENDLSNGTHKYHECDLIYDSYSQQFSILSSSVYLAGDANEDRKTSISDAVAILQNLANAKKYPLSEQGKLNADVDGVAGVTGKDAAVIQQYDAGIITFLPIN